MKGLLIALVIISATCYAGICVDDWIMELKTSHSGHYNNAHSTKLSTNKLGD